MHGGWGCGGHGRLGVDAGARSSDMMARGDWSTGTEGDALQRRRVLRQLLLLIVLLLLVVGGRLRWGLLLLLLLWDGGEECRPLARRHGGTRNCRSGVKWSRPRGGGWSDYQG